MKLNPIFRDHMVFAANLPIRVYGEGNGKVEISFAGQTATIVSEEDTWFVELKPMTYGGPYALTVSFETETVILEDIYVGEVYLFAGQSNMEWKLHQTVTPEELRESNDKLRLFCAPRMEEGKERFTPENGWVQAQKESIGDWSAIGYLAGNEISKSKNIAVGVICVYQGASVIESWVPEGTFAANGICFALDKETDTHMYSEDNLQWNKDGELYHFALHWAIPFSLTGVVWYQGESDSTEVESKVYGQELAILIDLWRKDFRREDLPFCIIQIADFDDRNDDAWRCLQQAQWNIQEKIPYVKTVISKDVCETEFIHPPTKHILASRVAKTFL